MPVNGYCNAAAADFSARPRATEVNSFPALIRSAPNRDSKIRRTAGTNDDPPVRNTISTRPPRPPTISAAHPHTPQFAPVPPQSIPRNRILRTIASRSTTPSEIPKAGRLMFRKIAFDFLHRPMQLIPKILLNQMNQRSNLLRMERLPAHAAEHIHHVFRLQQRKMMPAFQFRVDPNGTGRILSIERSCVPAPSAGETSLRTIFASKASPAIPTPAVPQQIARRPSAMETWPHMHERKIAGATAEIPDQDQFIMIERRFIVVRGGHRLHLKLNGFESRNPESLAQAASARNRPPLRLQRQQNEPVGPPPRTGSPFRTDAPPSHADPRRIRAIRSSSLMRLPNTSVLCKASARQKRFQRLNQTPPLLFGLQIALDTLRASPRLHRFPFRPRDLFKIEQRSVSIVRSPAEAKRREFHFPGVGRLRATELLVVPKSIPTLTFEI